VKRSPPIRPFGGKADLDDGGIQAADLAIDDGGDCRGGSRRAVKLAITEAGAVTVRDVPCGIDGLVPAVAEPDRKAAPPLKSCCVARQAKVFWRPASSRFPKLPLL
jgi:hypothetical protein